jgi:hypothetical protein
MAKPDPRKLMERAIEVMRQSVAEPRTDGKASPLVGVVLWKPDGSVETACRGELRDGDHAEYALLEHLNADEKASWQFIVGRESVTSPVLMEEMGFDERKAQRVLKALLDSGLLRRVGRGPATRYEVVRS